MEIHRRAARPSSNYIKDSSPTQNNVTKIISSRRPESSFALSSPYQPARTRTDVILFRSIQLLLSVAAAWFFYLIVAINISSFDGSNGLHELHDEDNLRGSSSVSLHDVVDSGAIATARERISQLRDEFYTRYGGKSESLEMLKRGLRTFENKDKKDAKSLGGSVRSTAERFLQAIVRHESSLSSSSSSQPEFVMAFGGYSVTVGRGNHFEQSFPFILEKLLSPILALPPLSIKFVVRNSAIGGIPSFPYGWCLPNFLGEDADAVSWDFAMNEGTGASAFESYVRRSLLLPKSPPLFVLVDVNSRPRLDILQKYVNLGFLTDPIALGGKDAVNKKLLELPEKKRPLGLRQWDKWGAPTGAPGQRKWHPKKMEHELMGWMMAMRLLDSVDAALGIIENNPDWRSKISTTDETDVSRKLQSTQSILPPPITDVSKTGAASLLHGTPMENDKSKWHMHLISCRTSFLPNIAGHLESIVESGVTNDEADMLKPRADSLFNGGLVVGGVMVPNGGISRISGVASYLNKDLCIRVGIPNEAKLSSKGEHDFGISLQVTVTGSGVSRENGACSISHVIWEHQ